MTATGWYQGKNRQEWLAALLNQAGMAGVTAPGGNDLTIRLTGRTTVPITTMARNPGEKNGCPDNEACIAPLEASANGVAVVDAFPSVVAVLEEPIRITIEHGRAVSRGRQP